jgi:hypothetical protein
MQTPFNALGNKLCAKHIPDLYRAYFLVVEDKKKIIFDDNKDNDALGIAIIFTYSPFSISFPVSLALPMRLSP